MKRLLPFVLAILFFLGLLIGIPVLLQPERYRQPLADRLSKQLDRPVLIGRLSIGVFPPALNLQDVSVLEREDPSPLLQAGRIQAPFAWSALLRGRVAPRGLLLERWALTLRRRPDGSWDAAELLKRSSGPAAVEAGALRKLGLRSGTLRWIDPYAASTQPRELVMQEIEGNLDAVAGRAQWASTLSGAVVPVTLAFEGRRAAGPGGPWTGELRLGDEGRQWIVQWQAENGKLDARGQAREWRLDQAAALARFFGRLGGIPEAPGRSPALLNDWRTHFTVQGSTLAFYHAGTIGGGLSEVRGELAPGPAGLVTRMKGTAQDVPLAALQPLTGSLPVLQGGRLSGLLTDFEVTLSSNPWAGLRARGNAEIRGGQLHFGEQGLKRLAKAKTMAYLRAKFPAVHLDGLEFSSLSGRFRSEGGQLLAEEGRLEAGPLRAGIVGRLDPARGGLDFLIRLQITERSPELLKTLPGRYIYGAPGHEKIQPIHGRLQGTWTDWILRATPESRIPPPIRAKLRQALPSR